jgi:hypothetical protein
MDGGAFLTFSGEVRREGPRDSSVRPGGSILYTSRRGLCVRVRSLERSSTKLANRSTSRLP